MKASGEMNYKCKNDGLLVVNFNELEANMERKPFVFPS